MGLRKHSSPEVPAVLSEPAHASSYEQVLQALSTDPSKGLSSAEAEARLEKYGPNQLEGGPGVEPLKIFLHQIANAMVLVLLIAMAVSFAIRSWVESAVIAFVFIVNVTVGYFQEYGAEKTMDSLRSLSSPSATVTRDSKTHVIPSFQAVPGDIVELKMGDTVPADLRLIEVKNFEVDEALLTGESMPVSKSADLVFDSATGPGDRLNLAYSSTTVTKGRATGVVVATGMMSEIGQIAKALQSKSPSRRPVKRSSNGKIKPHRYAQAWTLTLWDFFRRFLGVTVGTPLQRKLARLAIMLFGVAVVFALVVEASNNFSSYDQVIIYAVATGLSMIPASLVVVLTITMAVGTRVMVKRNVIVRKLDALEALGAITNICSDKTGTITQGKMVAKTAWIPAHGTYVVGPSSDPFDPTQGELYFTSSMPADTDIHQSVETKAAKPPEELLTNNKALEAFLEVSSLANLAKLHQNDSGSWDARGDPTEVGLMVFASRFGWNQERLTKGNQRIWESVAEFPFDSDIKRMSVIFRNRTNGEEKNNGEWVFTKGAVERILDACKTILLKEGEEVVLLNDQTREMIFKNVDGLAAEGLRVLALARKPWFRFTNDYNDVPRCKIESNLTFLGLVGLYDPPRPESAGAVSECQRAGIKVHMVTGDHPATARAIAIQVGILPRDTTMLSQDVAEKLVMTAADFDRLCDADIDALPSLPLVIARCAPNTKVRMIEALHRRKRFAAMTGDGVNDSPSLKRADVAIGMGTGSDVAKNASDIVLTDDNFASILNAIQEGRRMFDNIKKFVLHLLATNVAQACTLLIGLGFKDASGLSVFPISPVEILWIIMITSSFPAMGLGMEVAAPDIMIRRPHNLKRGIFTIEVMVDTIVYGFWAAVLCLTAFVLVVWGFGDGNLGIDCNDANPHQCDTVFRARATTFVCLTWAALLLAWQMVNMRLSFFRMQPESPHYFTQWTRDVWRNRFLFWSIMVGFVTVFPILYIPVVNHNVFRHTSISWEWGIVFVSSTMFMAGIEAWKWCKRAYFRRIEKVETADGAEKA